MDGILAKLMQRGNAAKRNIRGMLEDPIGILAQWAAQAGEDATSFRQRESLRQGQMVPGTPEDAAQERAAAYAAASLAPFGLTVYHGSPHRFDKFDASKIGTDEGAQAYGHGLYLAETKDTARTYKEALGGVDIKATVGNDVVRFDAGAPKGAVPFAASMMEANKNNKDAAIAAVEKMKKTDYFQYSPGFGDEIIKVLRNAKIDASRKELGYLYKVDLPDEQIAKMMDWDKPLSQQPEILKALKISLEILTSLHRVLDLWLIKRLVVSY